MVCFGGMALSLHSLLMQILLSTDLCLYFLADVVSGIQAERQSSEILPTFRALVAVAIWVCVTCGHPLFIKENVS